MSYFGIPIRNGLPIGLGSVAGFGVQQFSPADLFSAGEQGAWYDPSDFSTLFTDSAGTTPVTGVEQFVGRMNDKSGRGNHATSTGTKRPKLAARYNLLTYTEQFNNAAWTRNFLNIAANTATAPDGTLTADTATSAATTFSYAGRTAITVAGSNRWQMDFKYGSSRWVFMNFGAAGATAVWFDILNGVVGTQASGSVGNIISLGNGWFRCSVTRTVSAGSDCYFGCADADGATTSTSGVFAYVWGADLRPASQATGLIGPTYQRVVDATTYDAVGYLPYLAFDGIDDSMSTGSIDATAVDKTQVFAGIRKLSSATQLMYEFSADSDATNGSFGIGADATFEYFLRSRGTLFQQITVDNSLYAPPVTNVTALVSNIAAPSLIARINGAQIGSNTSSQGAGNYGNHPLFIGARNNASLFFNGWLSSLIVRFGANLSQSQIEATESWVNGKTGAF
jgi:hypothetical protein